MLFAVVFALRSFDGRTGVRASLSNECLTERKMIVLVGPRNTPSMAGMKPISENGKNLRSIPCNLPP
jgi:hypothetical protein